MLLTSCISTSHWKKLSLCLKKHDPHGFCLSWSGSYPSQLCRCTLELQHYSSLLQFLSEWRALPGRRNWLKAAYLLCQWCLRAHGVPPLKHTWQVSPGPHCSGVFAFDAFFQRILKISSPALLKVNVSLQSPHAPFAAEMHLSTCGYPP